MPDPAPLTALAASAPLTIEDLAAWVSAMARAYPGAALWLEYPQDHPVLPQAWMLAPLADGVLLPAEEGTPPVLLLSTRRIPRPAPTTGDAPWTSP